MMPRNMGFNASTASAIWMIVAAVLAIIGGIILYFTFLSKKKEGKYNKFLNWMYDFLTFKKMFIENLLKITYLILALFITLASFGTGSFLAFITTLVLGNLTVRVAYEFSLILLIICRNTTEINQKLCACEKEEKKETKKESKKEEASAE